MGSADTQPPTHPPKKKHTKKTKQQHHTTTTKHKMQDPLGYFEEGESTLLNCKTGASLPPADWPLR